MIVLRFADICIGRCLVLASAIAILCACEFNWSLGDSPGDTFAGSDTNGVGEQNLQPAGSEESARVASEAVNLPSIETRPVNFVVLEHGIPDSAHTGGVVLSDGGGEVTVRGVVWGNSPNPTTQNNSGRTYDAGGTGAYTSYIDQLVPGKRYYLRAYAINDAGTAYGNEEVFALDGEEATEGMQDDGDAASLANEEVVTDEDSADEEPEVAADSVEEMAESELENNEPDETVSKDDKASKPTSTPSTRSTRSTRSPRDRSSVMPERVGGSDKPSGTRPADSTPSRRAPVRR